jgi:hypothetical protein
VSADARMLEYMLMMGSSWSSCVALLRRDASS